MQLSNIGRGGWGVCKVMEILKISCTSGHFVIKPSSLPAVINHEQLFISEAGGTQCIQDDDLWYPSYHSYCH